MRATSKESFEPMAIFFNFRSGFSFLKIYYEMSLFVGLLSDHQVRFSHDQKNDQPKLKVH